MKAFPKIEHSGNAVYVVHTEDGPAVYPTLEDAVAAIKEDRLEVSEGDREYYDSREWLEVSRDTLAQFRS